MSEAEDSGAGMQAQLVEAAVALLAKQGPSAVQARQLAREVGASTMAVYHYFGGMPRLFAAVIDEGFRRLDAHLAAVPITRDPVTDLAELALAYRTAARVNPHLYDLMFGLTAPEHHGGQKHEDAASEEPSTAQRAYKNLVGACERAINAGRIHADEPAHAAAQLWSMLHGYVTLEMSGHISHPDGLRNVFIPMGINLLVGLGDTHERATQSVAHVRLPQE